MKAQLLAWPDVQRARRDAGSRYHECLRTTALSAGVNVPARLEHRFHTIAEELDVLVFFAPAESA